LKAKNFSIGVSPSLDTPPSPQALSLVGNQSLERLYEKSDIKVSVITNKMRTSLSDYI